MVTKIKWREKRDKNANSDKLWIILLNRASLDQQSPAQQATATIESLYRSGKTLKMIASQLNLSRSAVLRVLVANNVPRRIGGPRKR